MSLTLHRSSGEDRGSKWGGPGWGWGILGRPWLPRGGATALRGGATELMGDVIVVVLSERHKDRQSGRRRKRTREGGSGGQVEGRRKED